MKSIQKLLVPTDLSENSRAACFTRAPWQRKTKAF